MTIILSITVLVLYAAVREYAAYRTNRSYELLIAALREDQRTLMDRWYVSKGLSPAGVDASVEHVQRAEAKESAQRQRKVLRRGDPLQQERDRLILQEQSEIGLN
jgi:hypothetical protein